MDYAERKTEAELKKMERRVEAIYRDAWKDTKKEVDEYFAKFAVRDKQMLQLVKDGYIDANGEKWTMERYKQWRVAQIGRGERWEAMRDKLAKRMTETNKVAASYINDRTPGIYSLNANYAAYIIEQVTGRADFTLINEQAVKNILMGRTDHGQTISEVLGTKKYRQLVVDGAKDYAWNSKRIESALLTGLLKGVDMKKMTDAFFDVMGSNRKAAWMNARTAVISAQNAGHQTTYEAAVDMGIRMQKRWLATLDERTRESHQSMDGTVVNVDEKFHNGLLYPGDPSGAPDEVFRCRCRIIPVLPGLNDSPLRRIANTPNGQIEYLEGYSYKGHGGHESYKDWYKRKQERKREVIDVSSLEKQSHDALVDAYENQRITKGLKLLPYDPNSAFGDSVTVSFAKIDPEIAQHITDRLVDLTSRFTTTLKNISIMGKQEALFSQRTNAITSTNYSFMSSEIKLQPVLLRDLDKFTDKQLKNIESGWMVKIPEDRVLDHLITHEFAHTLLVDCELPKNKMNFAGADFKRIKNAQKEIRETYNEWLGALRKADEAYKKAEMDFIVGVSDGSKARELKIEVDRLKIGKYAMTDANEFMAEAFTLEDLGGVGNEYTKRIMETLKKYYGRN